MSRTDGKRIALFAGTTEGRTLAETIAQLEVPAALDIFVATDYGKEGLPEGEHIRVFCRRLDRDEMVSVFRENQYDLVVDATHPYAKLASENIREACSLTSVKLLRVLRPEENAGISGSGAVWVESVKEAVRYLKQTDGNVLVTTGSKELSQYKELPGWEERVYARVLSLPEVVSQCAEMGFYGAHLIAMQGPFSMEMNLALLNSTKARWLVTKESGKAGGFREKEEAAKRAGAGLIVIGRPGEEGITPEKAALYLREFCGAGRKKRRIRLVGAGPGNTEYLTVRAEKAFKECQLIAGSKRIVSGLLGFGKPVLYEYEPDKILDFLKAHREYTDVCVALSGDTGFYSGAKKLSETFRQEPDTEVLVVPGISSVNYFFAAIGESWEDVKLLSLHGRDADLSQTVKRNRKVFVLSGGNDGLKSICSRLLESGLSGVSLTVGENLSLPEERIVRGTPGELADTETCGPTVVFIENPEAKGLVTHGLPDEEFLREKIPMTKMEVRAVSVSRLGLSDHAVVYDLGAGTGSVSVECARLSENIRVYAVEKNPEAVKLLLRNREKFGLSNLEIVEGTAPEATKELPAPSHVFIGGSGGKMKQMVEAVLLKNPSARFVINVITLESMASVMDIIKTEPVTDVEITQLTAARSHKAGSSHLMMGQNPVWIVSFTGGR